jgi:hypothetical protein
MRYFHHFLVRAYPHLPVGGDTLWTTQIPAFAHQYDYLMHAMLGMGASHLALHTSSTPEIQAAAFAHRITAVKRLNDALSRAPKDVNEVDARFATLMVLTFQSACISEGLFDYLTTLRGCVMAGGGMGNMPKDSSFRRHMAGGNRESMRERVVMAAKLCSLDTRPLDDAAESLKILEPYVKPGIEQEYHSVLTTMVQAGLTSHSLAYFHMIRLYQMVGRISAADFHHLMDKSNGICQILLGHFLATHFITRHVAFIESPMRDVTSLYHMMQTWVCVIHASLDPKLRHLHQWPLSYVASSSPLIDELEPLKSIDALPTMRIARH